MPSGNGLPATAPAAVQTYALLHGPRTPVSDPMLGQAIKARATYGTPNHRIVAIGDSLTHGFQSGAVYNTDLSYPAIIATEMGWSGFRRPHYQGRGGLPLNIEMVLRDLEDRFGPDIDLWETPYALFHLRDLMDDIEDYWERGGGAPVPPHPDLMHALAVFGWNLRDALVSTAASCTAAIGSRTTDNLINQRVQNSAERAALRVLPTSPTMANFTVFDTAATLAADHGSESESGIETLIVMLGANNALRTVCDLRLTWTRAGGQGAPTMWAPEDFTHELNLVADQVARIGARHVIWGTVPHITIAPLARGVGGKSAPASRYFAYYTRPWLTEAQFDPSVHPHLTDQQARAIDYGIDLFNEAITAAVERGRATNYDWYLFDLASLLDRLATRRYIDDPAAQPSWWTPYTLPKSLAALTPTPDTRFLTANGQGDRASGGLFSLDGIHPTTIGYGIIAQEIITIMQKAGVEFRHPDQTPRSTPVTVDFDYLIQRDSLVTHPPQNLTSTLGILGWADTAASLFGKALAI